MKNKNHLHLDNLLPCFAISFEFKRFMCFQKLAGNIQPKVHNKNKTVLSQLMESIEILQKKCSKQRIRSRLLNKFTFKTKTIPKFNLFALFLMLILLRFNENTIGFKITRKTNESSTMIEIRVYGSKVKSFMTLGTSIIIPILSQKQVNS